MHSNAFCLFSVIFLVIDFSNGLIKTGEECCKVGRFMSRRDGGGGGGCHLIQNLDDPDGPDAPETPDYGQFQCRLQATYCCLQQTKETICQRVSQEFLGKYDIQEFFHSVIGYQTSDTEDDDDDDEPLIQMNLDQLWPILSGRYSSACQTGRGREEYFCCVGCVAGMVAAVKHFQRQHLQWGSRITEPLRSMDAGQWCTVGNVSDATGTSSDFGFRHCCHQTIQAINGTIKWCEQTPAPCSHRCHEARRGTNEIHCSCYEGYRLSTSDGRSCIDVDECQELTHTCHPDFETCHNIEGGFQCLPKNDSPPVTTTVTPFERECSKGFRFNSTYNRCKDIDECQVPGWHRCNLTREVCRNLIGSYTCIHVPLTGDCPGGFRRDTMALISIDDHGCRDIDECREGHFDCDYLREDCENTIGSYVCEEKLSSTSTSMILDPLIITNDKNDTKKREATSCPKGYHFVRFSYQCEDIDECRIGQHNCDLSLENCVNYPGSYQCVYVKEAAVIDDVRPPETLDGTVYYYRTKNQSIIGDLSENLKPNIVHCRDGFERNELLNICDDINECSTTGSGPCPENSYCQNTIGSFVCHCKAGFIKNFRDECEDLDECRLGLSHCPASGTMQCVNTIGSFECRMKAPYVPIKPNITHSPKYSRCPQNEYFDPNLNRCIKEKNFSIGLQNQSTSRTDRFRTNKKCKFGERMLNGHCQPVACGQGYFYNATDNRCQDSNECLEYYPCKSTEMCINTIGSYRCSRKCNLGYRARNGSVCEDIDECSMGTYHCSYNKICKNTPGSYRCECRPGFVEMSDGGCHDIDECNSRPDSSAVLCDDPETQRCVNTVGSYRCECRTGYRKSNMTRPGSMKCADIDECHEATGLNRCQHSCQNYAGSYRCSCHSGYRLANDGFSCIDEDECQMFQDDFDNIENDLDDDESNDLDFFYNHNQDVRKKHRNQDRKPAKKSLCQYKCLNVPGSFECVCPSGYETQAQGRICRDIDECERDPVCLGQDEYCLNIRGGYRCFHIDCPSGYYFESKTKKCIRHLEGVFGYRDLSEPISYSYNYLSIVSNIRIPKQSRYLDLVSMSSPAFSVPGVQFNLTLKAAKPGRPGIRLARREDFHLRHPIYNQILVSLVRPLVGPQDVELEVTVSLYSQEPGSGLQKFAGSSKAIIFIVVSEYEF